MDTSITPPRKARNWPLIIATTVALGMTLISSAPLSMAPFTFGSYFVIVYVIAYVVRWLWRATRRDVV